MKKAYRISIELPCKEDWNAMTEHGNGRFCSVCLKTVVDFTKMSDAEIIKIIQSNKEMPCGRYTSQQVSRPLIAPQPSKASALFSRLLSGLLLLATGYQLTAKESATKTEIVSPRDVQMEKGENEVDEQVLQRDTLKNWIQGRVVDAKTKEALPAVSVTIKGTKIGTITEMDGSFKLKIPELYLTDEILLYTSYIGYENNTIKVLHSKMDALQMVYLIEMTEAVMGAVVIHRKHWWQFWK